MNSGSSDPHPRLDETADFDRGAPRVEPPTELPETIGRFRVESVLGCGGFGTVYLAYDDELQRRVAIKVPHKRLLASSEVRDAFLSEARILAALDHPGIVPVYDVGRTDDGSCYVVSKPIDGRTLETEILSGQLTHTIMAELVARLAEALDYAHQQGFVHRDIKPANIVVDAENRPYITDLGLALHEHGLQWGRLTGTPAYMSPEQARGESHLVDGRSDIYSLGAVFYKMLTGREPFFCDGMQELLESIRSQPPRPPSELEPSTPPEMERICLKALSKRASERYARASELADDLHSWLVANGKASGNRAGAPGASADQRVRIVPKGLRSFDGGDADFFLQLLPGPYDRDGLPESIRFWLSLVEERDPDRTFRAGLVYGPSGCGKSSMMKAGLLPRLDDTVIPAYVEATPEETERRLLRAIGNRFPGLADTADLAESLSRLRSGKHLPPGKKLLIVLDQFEQWLHAKQPYAGRELVAALRQCDGGRIQCILLVRDDFWMAVTRFHRELEVPLVEGRNSASVDLFDLDHSRRVLAQFGTAYDRLPDYASDRSDQQRRFLEQSVEGLARDGRVIPVQLALFAEMVKAKPWHPDTLVEVGGTEGIGLTFLEETFSAAHAPPAHRSHQQAIRSVLSLLLPETGNGLKGSMQSREELLAASGYGNQPEDFEAVIEILNQLHLITPTDPEGAAFDEETREIHAGGSRKYYQLTHEYLIPPLHEWLTRKRRETPRGRASLLLEERTHQWTLSRQNRLLPSLRETVQIVALTPRVDRTPPQRELIRRAVLVHGRRLGVLAAIVAGLALLLVFLIPKPPGQYGLLTTFSDSGQSRSARIDAFDRLQVNDVHIFPRVVEALKTIEDPDVVQHALERLARLAAEDPEAGTAGAGRSIQDPLIELLLGLFDHPSGQVQRKAFDFYARLAQPPAVVETIRQLAGEAEPQLAEGMVAYVEQLDLEQLDATVRATVLRELTAMLRQNRHTESVAAIVIQFDRLPPVQLVDWLRQSRDPWEAKTAAKETLAPYMAKTTRQRRHDVAQHVEISLARRVQKPPQDVATTYELEYEIQALGQIASLGDEVYDVGLTSVAWLLSHRKELSDTDILDTVIEAFVELNRDKRVPLDPLREVLADEGEPWANRDAAAKAVGDLADLDSFELLKRLAADNSGVLNVRCRAIESQGKLGQHLALKQPAAPALAEIITILRGLLEDYESEPQNVVRVALAAYGELGHAEDAEVLFPLLADRLFNVDAIVAELTILTRHPDDAYEVVREYLPWRTDAGRLTNVPESPDRALVGFSHYLNPSVPCDEAGRAVAAALARAAAEMQDEACRRLAAQLLADFLLDDAAPPIDPAADQEQREAQLQAWKAWWDGVDDQLHLKAGQLRRVSTGP